MCLGWLDAKKKDPQVMVPCTTVPFLSSIVTVSLLSFIKNLNISIRAHAPPLRAHLTSFILKTESDESKG